MQHTHTKKLWFYSIIILTEEHGKYFPEFTLGFFIPASILYFHLRQTEDQEIVKLRYPL